MTKHFEQLSAEERETIMVMAQEGQSLRAMARTCTVPSMISGNGAACSADRCTGEQRLRRQAGWPGSPTLPLPSAHSDSAALVGRCLPLACYQQGFQ